MSAFNKRFQPFEIWGLPGAGLIGMLLFLVGGMLFFLLPIPVNFLFGVIGVVAFFVAVAALVLGDEFMWTTNKLMAFIEGRITTQFGREE